MAVYGRSLLNQLCVIETIAPAAQRCDTSEVWLSWLLTDTLDTLLMELERARATWLVAENIALTPFSSLPRLHRRWTPFNTSFFAMNRRKMKRPLNALIRSKMKKKRWCWNEDGGGLTCCWTELLPNDSHCYALWTHSRHPAAMGCHWKGLTCHNKLWKWSVRTEYLMKKRKVTIKSLCLWGCRFWLTLIQRGKWDKLHTGCLNKCP